MHGVHLDCCPLRCYQVFSLLGLIGVYKLKCTLPCEF
uniref:Uncharacterized protein n=1 Tax=Arundo donax TaxID=35708 RepID=A0A0A9HJ40_ARUDO